MILKKRKASREKSFGTLASVRYWVYTVHCTSMRCLTRQKHVSILLFFSFSKISLARVLTLFAPYYNIHIAFFMWVKKTKEKDDAICLSSSSS